MWFRNQALTRRRWVDSPMAHGWKRAAEVVVARSGVLGWRQRRSRPSTVILAYHNIVPRGEAAVGDLSLHIDQDVFAEQLDFILERHVVVELTALSVASNGSDQARVVITFDDAYRGTLEAGIGELEKRRVPATVFVPPGLLGSDGFWWDRLAPDGGVLDPALRLHALTALRGKADEILRWARDQGLSPREMPEHACPVTAQALENSSVAGAITFGAHTWGHPNLATLPPDEVRHELDLARDWLVAKSGRYVDWLAYPYGLHSGEVLRAAESFAGALLISGGAAQWRGRTLAPRHATPRVSVPRGMSLEGLELRLAGLA